jgi:hypothetical protein
MRISDLFLPPMDSYDTQLALEGEDICRVLDLPKHVRQITWLDRIFWHTYDSDRCGFGRIVGYFPAQMKGRLEPKEWRPLMASSRILRQIHGNPPVRSIFGSIFAAFILLLGIAGASVEGFGWRLALDLVLITAGALVLVNSYTQGQKTLKLQADLLAARVEGRQQFLSVLRKIQTFGLTDIVNTEKRGFRRHFSSRPSLSERIHNLELFNEG